MLKSIRTKSGRFLAAALLAISIIGSPIVVSSVDASGGVNSGNSGGGGG